MPGDAAVAAVSVSAAACVVSVLAVSFADVSVVDEDAAEPPQPVSMDAVMHILKIVASNFFFFILSSPF